MSPERWSEVKAFVKEVQTLGASEREERIRQAHADEPEFRREVLELLDQCSRSTHWLSSTDSWRRPGSEEPTPLPDPAPVLSSGDMCGPYRLKRQIGAGGMGLVFLAEDTVLGTDVALKTLKVRRGHESKPSQTRTRMLDEAARQAALRGHPHIATLLHVIEGGPNHRWPVLVMEYVDGTPANAQVANGPVRASRVLRWATQVSSAIDHAHNRGILHCDLKPANIQITTNDDAKVLDFGLARAIHPSSEGIGTFEGTLPYMAPEQLAESRFSEASDIYSFGVTLFELFTGRRPFDATKQNDLILEILGCPPPKASACTPGLPAGLDEVLERAMAKDPRQRFRTARALTDDLCRVFEVPQPVVRPKPAQRIAGIAMTTIIVATLMGFITSRALDQGLGRAGLFGTESPLWWPIWGFMSLTAPVVTLLLLFVGLYLLWILCRIVFKIRPVRWLCTPIVGLITRCSDRVLKMPKNVVAQILLAMQIVVLVVLGWHFYPLLVALVTFVDPNKAGSLVELRPGNWAMHNRLRFLSSLDLFFFSAAWYSLLRKRSGDNPGVVPRSCAAAGVAVIALTLFVFAMPFRPLYFNSHEKVTYGAEPCYLIARREDEALLFCPLRFPRTRTVSGTDPRLVKTGITEDIFTEFDRSR